MPASKQMIDWLFGEANDEELLDPGLEDNSECSDDYSIPDDINDNSSSKFIIINNKIIIIIILL